jgi:hypothetical protein
MNGRAVFGLLAMTVIATASCSRGGNNDERASATLTRAEIELPPILCTLQPWADGGHPCGETSVVHQRITCGDLGTSGVTLTPADHGDGYRSAIYRNENGIETEVVNGTVQTGDQTFRDWSFGTNVNADGSTMTFDTLAFVGVDSSFVVKLAQPQFNVRDVFPTVGEVATIQVCGYKPGHAASLPPPEPDAGPFTVTCSGNGSPTPPGVTVHSLADIRWAVKVDPAPAQGALIAMSSEVDGGAVGLGTSFLTLASGQLSGGYSSPYLHGRHGSLSLQFGYGTASCAMYWNVIEDGSDLDAGTGSRTW